MILKCQVSRPLRVASRSPLTPIYAALLHSLHPAFVFCSATGGTRSDQLLSAQLKQLLILEPFPALCTSAHLATAHLFPRD